MAEADGEEVGGDVGSRRLAGPSFAGFLEGRLGVEVDMEWR